MKIQSATYVMENGKRLEIERAADGKCVVVTLDGKVKASGIVPADLNRVAEAARSICISVYGVHSYTDQQWSRVHKALFRFGR